MPSSLERFLSRALVYSTHPPVSVYGTGGQGNDRLLFSADCPVMRFARRLGSRFDRIITFLSVSLAVKCRRCRNIDLLGIDYALRPRLSSRLTLGGRTCPRKPWVYGDRDSHPVYRYSCLHSHWSALHLSFPSGFTALTTLSYRATPCGWHPRLRYVI